MTPARKPKQPEGTPTVETAPENTPADDAEPLAGEIGEVSQSDALEVKATELDEQADRAHRQSLELRGAARKLRAAAALVR